MLRLALIENLRRVAARIGADRVDRNRADYWADQMTAIAEKDPKSLILVIADMARSGPPMVGSFVAEFARRLQGKSPALALPLDVDRTAAVGGRPDDRAAGAVGEPAAGRRPGFDQQQHQQPAVPRRRRLARLRRGAERRRADPARGSGRRVRRGWTSPRATSTATSSRRRPGGAALREERGGPAARSSWPGRPPRQRGPDAQGGARRLLPRRQGARAARASGRARASPSPRPCGARASATRCRSISGASSLLTVAAHGGA